MQKEQLMFIKRVLFYKVEEKESETYFVKNERGLS